MTSSSKTRQRRQQQQHDEDGVELLDQDDQEKLIQELEAEAKKQHDQIETAFLMLCRTAALISVLSAWLVVQRHRPPSSLGSPHSLLVWTHAGLAALWYWNTPSIVVGKNTAETAAPSNRIRTIYSQPAVVAVSSVLVAAVDLFQARQYKDWNSLYLHYSLIGSNVLFTAVAVYLRRERGLSEKSVKDLRDSKYHYKGL